jgi:hypothetical protein
MLVNDVSLRNIPAEVAKGFGFPQSKGSDRVLAGRSHPRRTRHGLRRRQGKPAARQRCERAAVRQTQCRRRHDLRFFPTLVAHAVRTRPLNVRARSSAAARCRTAMPMAVPEGPLPRRRGLFMYCRDPIRRNNPLQRAENSASEFRRPSADLDVRSRRPVDLRRHRSGARARPMRRCSRRRARLPQAGIRIADSMSLQASAQAVQASAQTRQ